MGTRQARGHRKAGRGGRGNREGGIWRERTVCGNVSLHFFGFPVFFFSIVWTGTLLAWTRASRFGAAHALCKS